LLSVVSGSTARQRAGGPAHSDSNPHQTGYRRTLPKTGTVAFEQEQF